MSEDGKEQFSPVIDWERECMKWEHEYRDLAAKLQDAEYVAYRARCVRAAIVDRLIDARAEMLDAIHGNDAHQYDEGVRAARRVIDELLDLLVEWKYPKGEGE